MSFFKNGQALIELVLEKGYEAVRIQDIVDRANLWAATLYLHYRNKEDLPLSLPANFVSKYTAGSLLALITQWLEDDAGYSADYLGEISDRLVLRGIMGLLEP